MFFIRTKYIILKSNASEDQTLMINFVML